MSLLLGKSFYSVIHTVFLEINNGPDLRAVHKIILRYFTGITFLV